MVVTVGDIHTNSTLGLCPPEGVSLDDGGHYSPNKIQMWIWECWDEFWTRVAERRAALDADLYVAINGEFTDGDHHHTSQIITRNPATMLAQAYAAMDRIKVLSPDRWFVTRGTEAHSGTSGQFDETMARMLGAEPDPATGASSWWNLRMTVNGVNLSIAHHGRGATRPWTLGNAPNNLAAQLVNAYAYDDWKPHLALRGHHHYWGDSYDNHRIRVIQAGAWQLSTSFGHRIAADDPPGIGGVYVVCQDGKYEVEKGRFRPVKGSIWTG